MHELPNCHQLSPENIHREPQFTTVTIDGNPFNASSSPSTELAENKVENASAFGK